MRRWPQTAPMHIKKGIHTTTVSTNAMFITMSIGVAKNRDIAACDIAGACIHTNMKTFAVMNLEGEMVDMTTYVDPEKTTEHVGFENEKGPVS